MNFQTKDSRLKLQNGFDISGTTTSTKMFIGGDVSNSIFTLDASGEVYLRTSKVKIGVEAGLTDQSSNCIAIGNQAGYTRQGVNSIAVGLNSGFVDQSSNSVAIGNLAGQTNQGASAVAIGFQAGANTQGIHAIAIGTNSGQSGQRDDAIAIGQNAGNLTQGVQAIAIGSNAGSTNQGCNSIAIGVGAGQIGQGEKCVAIGFGAGCNLQQAGSIAIGNLAGSTGQGGNTIVLNASATTVTGATASAFYVSPVRTETAGSVSLLFYNNSSKELTMSSAPTSLSNKTFVIPHPLKQNKYLIHACLEGPEAGVYYRGVGHFQKDEKNTEILLPDYVKALAQDFTVHVSSIDDDTDNYFILKVSHIKQNKFIVHRHSITNDYSSSQFNWIVYGKRSSIDVEVDKNQVEIKGQGPYQYITNKI
jgi:hypothetical protein